ncbi:uncharacterized protein LOC144281976 [Canis aureus]
MRVRLSVLPGLRRGRHGPPGLVVTFAFLSRTDVTAPGTVRPAEEVQSALFRLRCTKAQWPWAAGRRDQAGPRNAEDCAPASAVGFPSERRETAATTCTHAPFLVQACADWPKSGGTRRRSGFLRAHCCCGGCQGPFSDMKFRDSLWKSCEPGNQHLGLESGLFY